ncbi:MAG: hypothetical protein HY428_01695 [Candidatus Levybacteria bacterium]|nr:hypothetical protein [Candidatus Levybacteria bacterium]
MSKKTGVIGVSANMSKENIDKKLVALLMKSTKKIITWQAYISKRGARVIQ